MGYKLWNITHGRFQGNITHNREITHFPYNAQKCVGYIPYFGLYSNFSWVVGYTDCGEPNPIRRLGLGSQH